MGEEKKELGIHCLDVCLISQKSWKPGIIVLDLHNHDIIILNATHFPTNDAVNLFLHSVLLSVSADLLINFPSWLTITVWNPLEQTYLKERREGYQLPT